jgi:hypothetical protein
MTLRESQCVAKNKLSPPYFVNGGNISALVSICQHNLGNFKFFLNQN